MEFPGVANVESIGTNQIMNYLSNAGSKKMIPIDFNEVGDNVKKYLVFNEKPMDKGKSAIVYRSEGILSVGENEETYEENDRYVVKVFMSDFPAHRIKKEREFTKRGGVEVYQLLSVYEKIHLIMEYLPGETLNEFISNDEFKNDIDLKLELAEKLSENLSVIHKNNIVHRDISLRNIKADISDDNSEIRSAHIFDFGSSKESSEIEDDAIYGTPDYLSPESINRLSSKKSDIFSFGKVLYYLFDINMEVENFEILNQFEGSEELKGIIYESEDGCQPLSLDHVYRILKIIGQALNSDPEKRPEAHEIKQCLNAISAERNEMNLNSSNISTGSGVIDVEEELSKKFSKFTISQINIDSDSDDELIETKCVQSC